MSHCTKHEGCSAFCPSLGFPNDRVTDQGLPLGGLLLNQSQGIEIDLQRMKDRRKNNY